VSHAIAGARGHVADPEAVLRQAQAWASRHGSEVCLADARTVFGRDHLESAALHAERAKDSGTMATRSLSMETLLYVSGKRQVADAIRVAGLRLDSEAVGLVLFGPTDLDDFLREMAWSRDDSVMSAEEKSLEAFGISKAQATTVSYARRLDLVLEKVALVDLEK
jgi:KEOPS complex subunit Cgi121